MASDPGFRRVALVRPRVGLGDWLCTLPALRVLRAARPDLRLTVITYPEMRPLLARIPELVDAALPFPGYPGIPERPVEHTGWPGFVAAARRAAFDLALQGYGDRPAANAVAESLGAPRVGGFAPTGWSPRRDAALHLRYPVWEHEVWRHLRWVERLGVAPPDGLDPVSLMGLPVWPVERRRFASLCRRHELRPGEYAVLHPGASAATRRWPPGRFAELGDALAARGLRVVLGGVRGERRLTRRIRRLMRAPALDLAGATSLGGYTLLLAGAVVVVSGDTGAAHLAVATGTPAVTIFMSGDPVRWAYPGDRQRVVRAAVVCSPCSNLRCPLDLRCATRVPVTQVLADVDTALGP